jgi:hypothetical protein
MKSITISNVVQELFSDFGAKYMKPREHLLSFVKNNIVSKFSSFCQSVFGSNSTGQRQIKKQSELQDQLLSTVMGTTYDAIWAKLIPELLKE